MYSNRGVQRTAISALIPALNALDEDIVQCRLDNALRYGTPDKTILREKPYRHVEKPYRYVEKHIDVSIFFRHIEKEKKVVREKKKWYEKERKNMSKKSTSMC